MKSYPVVEIFDSIQGEGTWMGRPVTFIRLGGCNLSCSWCDTKFDEFTDMTIEEIVAQMNWRDVVITGGEPMMYDLLPLIDAVRFGTYKGKDHFRTVCIETNGTFSTAEIQHAAYIVCSPKPQEGWMIHPMCLPDEVKYVVDGIFHPSQIMPHIWRHCKGKIWLQPESSHMKENMKAAYDMAQKHPGLRVGVQLHKIMEVR